MAVPSGGTPSWTLSVAPVGPVGTLLQRLLRQAAGASVAFGVDFPVGLPRRYAELHAGPARDFPEFLRALGRTAGLPRGR